MRWGIVGTALAVLLNALLVNPYSDYIFLRITHVRAWEFIKLVAVPAFGTATMCSVLLILRVFELAPIGLQSFITSIVIGIIIYIGIIASVDSRLWDLGPVKAAI